MFGLGLTEVIVIAVVALLALGPERIPGVARSIGRTLAELRRAVDEVKREFALHDILRPPPPTNTIGGLLAEPPKLENRASADESQPTAQAHPPMVEVRADDEESRD